MCSALPAEERERKKAVPNMRGSPPRAQHIAETCRRELPAYRWSDCAWWIDKLPRGERDDSRYGRNLRSGGLPSNNQGRRDEEESSNPRSGTTQEWPLHALLLLFVSFLKRRKKNLLKVPGVSSTLWNVCLLKQEST